MNSRKNTPQHIDPEQNRNIIKEKVVGQTEENGVEMNLLKTKREENAEDTCNINRYAQSTSNSSLAYAIR